MGRGARGVTAMKLHDGDYIIDMEAVDESCSLLTVTEKGYGKRTKVSAYRKTRRGGSGVINIKMTDDNGPVIGMLEVDNNDEIVLLTQTGMIIRTSVEAIPETGRNTIGRILIRLHENDKVIGVSPIEKEDKKLPPAPPDVTGSDDSAVISDDDSVIDEPILEDEPKEDLPDEDTPQK